ncbi:hypothetical protein LR48_Vigan07g268000 [Vigna angularis]|uniref:B-like cyclin n=2 Tax=Phaseolus angularis TaxID=3914 RepID=A0A0L9V213_PHAAN|nr:cyclin-D3-1 [Vigna angularis]KAG2390333.1 Cyclin-D3-3 G1/S-specific cyclin-D3-3 [Vigna angularis]KOM48976.1 hypothetical protein LR48_Vigan07g268000 [Vigna angularis]BAT82623.1 hypothetical protein VIGAN_03266600 [Vigna angularis var. angularis]
MSHHYPKPLLDTLFCLEDNIHLEEEKQREEDDYIGTTSKPNSSDVVLSEQDLFWDTQELSSLLAKENLNSLSISLPNNPSLASSRGEAVDWILKLNLHHSFSTLTALLAVNYLDRFLFTLRFQNDKPWLTQLVAVACLSLAAKVEETHVPLFVDLQVGESKYLFEAKTVKRMEILVLSTLGWKMNPVTPLSFLDYITRKLGLKGHLCLEFLRRCETVLLSVFAESRFMSFLPSVLATATTLRVVSVVEPGLGEEYQDQLLGILGIDKEKVKECYKVMMEIVSGKSEEGKRGNLKKRKFECIQCSRNDVMEGSFSCDSSCDSWELGASLKKSRSQDQLLLKHSNSDFLTIPR